MFLGAPSAPNLSLALRQAIWRKTDPGWAVHGLPDVLYADHGSDFTSDHLAQVTAELHVRLVHSTIARPQGRGKLERFFGTVTTELLPDLPGHLVRDKPSTSPRLTLPQLDAVIGRWVTSTYHQRPHSETGQPPQQAWLGDGWLPRTPDSLEQLDLLLVMVAKPRVVHRDGIRFQGLRYLDPALAAYVGEPVTIRYDPRDLGEVRVFHRNRFLCRAISPSTPARPSRSRTSRPPAPPTAGHFAASLTSAAPRSASTSPPSPPAPPNRRLPPAPHPELDPQQPGRPRRRLHTYPEDKT